jgi:predicted kinase
MKTLYLMCGLSFSGKTTLARKIVERLQCAYISLDDINAERGLWGGDGISVGEWERTPGRLGSVKQVDTDTDPTINY